MAGWSVTETTGTFEELHKHLIFHCSCCKMRSHRRIRMVTLGHVRIWHQPQQMPREEYGNRASTRKSPCPSHSPPSLSPPPAQGHCLLRAAQKRQSRDCFTNWCGTLASSTSLLHPKDISLCPKGSHLSHPGRGSPGIGSSPFSTQKPSRLQETSPEGLKGLCNYQDSAKAQF